MPTPPTIPCYDDGRIIALADQLKGQSITEIWGTNADAAEFAQQCQSFCRAVVANKTKESSLFSQREDLADQAWFRAMERFGSYVGDGEQIIKWLRKNCINLIIDHGRHKDVHRRNKRNLGHHVRCRLDTVPSPVDAAIKNEEAGLVQAALATLSQMDQDALTVKVDDEAIKDAAKKRVVSPDVLSMRIFRASKRLAIILAPTCHDPEPPMR